MAKTNKSIFAILGFLNQNPMTGYEIKQWIERSIGYFWSESYGQIYPILKKLVSRDLATVKVIDQDGKPDRKVYTITEKGRNALKAWLIKSVEPANFRYELLLKLFFGREVDLKVNISHLQKQKLEAEESLMELQLIEKNLKKEHAGHPDLNYWLVTLHFGISHYKQILIWCKDSIKLLLKNK